MDSENEPARLGYGVLLRHANRRLSIAAQRQPAVGHGLRPLRRFGVFANGCRVAIWVGSVTKE